MNRNKKKIRLTESDLHNIIKESVNKILNEIGDTSNGQYLLGKLAQRQLHKDKNPKKAFNTMWYAGDQNLDNSNSKSNSYREGMSDGQKKFMKETRLDYDDIDYCLGKYKDDYIDANDCLDDPYNKPCSFEDEDWIGGDKDLEKDYSWDLFNRKSVAPGVGGYYTVNKHGIQKDVDDAHTIRNRKKNWTKQELNNGDRMMHKWLQGKRELEDIDDSWNSIH
jgi:hypothetical protein